MNRVGFRLFRGNNGRDVFQKIHATLFAFAAFALRVFARRAFVAHGAMAALAEARHFANVCAAFRAFDCWLFRRGCAKR